MLPDGQTDQRKFATPFHLQTTLVVADPKAILEVAEQVGETAKLLVLAALTGVEKTTGTIAIRIDG